MIISPKQTGTIWVEARLYSYLDQLVNYYFVNGRFLSLSKYHHKSTPVLKSERRVWQIFFITPSPLPFPPYDLRYQISHGFFFFRHMFLDILTLCRLTLESDDLFRLLGIRV